MEILSDPWIITIGGAIVSGLVLYYLFGIGKEKHINQKGINIIRAKKITAGKNVVINQSSASGRSVKKNGSHNNSRITPASILEEMKNLSPWERNRLKNKYKGLKVSWRVEFRDLIPKSKNEYDLITSYPYGNFWVYVVFTSDTNLYPKLKSIKEKSSLIVDGVISSLDCSGVSITLENCKLKFLTRQNNAS